MSEKLTNVDLESKTFSIEEVRKSIALRAADYAKGYFILGVATLPLFGMGIGFMLLAAMIHWQGKVLSERGTLDKAYKSNVGHDEFATKVIMFLKPITALLQGLGKWIAARFFYYLYQKNDSQQRGFQLLLSNETPVWTTQQHYVIIKDEKTSFIQWLVTDRHL